ncbi:MAG: DUF4388 domain-containing protein [Acidobacteriota bacterium]|nr:MAG: DUF4388 domain-containing protein [Acidobacteriota bacterium]
MSLADLLQWLASSQQTGRIDFCRGSIVKEIFVQDGLIVGAASNLPTEMLGHVLIARGKLTEEQLRAALAAREDLDEFLGQVLVRLGFVERDDLLRALAERTEEVVYSLFEWEEVEFHFEPGARPGPRVVLISMPVDHVLLRGVHRHDEMLRIREVFPDGRVVLARGDKKPPEEILKHSLARRIFESLDGRLTLDEIAFQLHASRYPVMKFLHEAYRLGLVKIVSLDGPPLRLTTSDAPDAELAGLSGPARVVAAKESFHKGELDAALALVSDEVIEQDSETIALRTQIERAFVRKVYRDEFASDSVPELERSLDELSAELLRPEEVFLLSRIDGQWTIGEIVDVAPAREAETLLALRRLIRRGLIRVPQHTPA